MQGQWKQISRYFVPSRTPTQVASHAQKHFLRVAGATKRRSRFAAVEEGAIASGMGLSQTSRQPINIPSSSGASGPPCSFLASLDFLSPPTTGALPDTPCQPPQPDASGLAIGIPVPRIPLATTPTGKLPLLRVLPGRISATVEYGSTASGENRSRSHLNLNNNRTSQEHSGPKRPTTVNIMKKERQSLRVLNKKIAKECGGLLDASRTASASSESASVSAAHSALDALAGVAAALADSAATF